MKRKILLPLLVLFNLFALLFCAIPCGITYAAWTKTTAVTQYNTVNVEVKDWIFADTDFAKIDNISNCNYLIASQENAIISPNGSLEAVRFTNTAGTQNKAHSFNLSFDRDYTLSEIRFYKVEFDYYHAEKREQSNKGLPKVQLLYNTSTKGSDQGGTDSANEKSPYICTNIDENWWHLEYFITALCPTMADHQDTPLALNTKINGIKITDNNIYDYNSQTAFIVVDNFRLSSEPSSRLGLFNRTTSFSAGTYYWFKVAWTGELESCVITCSDNTIAEQDLDSTKSPFYIRGLSAGTFTATATLTMTSGQVLSISNTLTVK